MKLLIFFVMVKLFRGDPAWREDIVVAKEGGFFYSTNNIAKREIRE